MKFSLLPAVLCISLLAAAQEAKPSAPPPAPAPAAAPNPAPAAKPNPQVIAQASDRPESGRVVDDVYSSDYFGFSLTLPKGWEVEDREALQKSVDESYQRLYGGDPQAQAANQDARARAYMLLSAQGRLAMETVPSQVQIAAEQLPEDAGVATGKDYLDAVGALPPQGGLELKALGPPAEVKLGGQSFWRQDYGASTTLNGKPVSIAYAEYVSVQRGYALILSFWTDTPEHLAELVKHADSVKFSTPDAASPPK